MLTAFLLGAGLGTRLRPLTENLPKPLVPVANKPLVTYALDHLLAAGWERFLINTHHCAEAWTEVFGGDGHLAEYRGCPLHFRHEPLLLETGGGLKNMEDLAGSEDLLLYNADTLQDLDVRHLWRVHREQGNLVTLGLRSSGGPLAVRWDAASGDVLDIGGRLGDRGVPAGPSFLFTGVYAVSPEIFPWIPPREPISIIPILLDLLRARRRVAGVLLDAGSWRDLGEPSAYLEAHRWLAESASVSRKSPMPMASPSLMASPVSWSLAPQQKTPPPFGTRVQGFLFTGENVEIPDTATLEDCVLWDGAQVEPGAHLTRCVVRSGKSAGGRVSDRIF